MLTYSQALQRGRRVASVASILGFVVIAGCRVQLAAGLTTPAAYDATVWVVMISVTSAVLITTAVYVWLRVSDWLAVQRHQMSPQWHSETESSGGRHRRARGVS